MLWCYLPYLLLAYIIKVTSTGEVAPAARRTLATSIIVCGVQLITLVLMITRTLMHPCGSPSTVCSVQLNLSSQVVIGIFIETSEEAKFMSSSERGLMSSEAKDVMSNEPISQPFTGIEIEASLSSKIGLTGEVAPAARRTLATSIIVCGVQLITLC
jgi:hypothetical protein